MTPIPLFSRLKRPGTFDLLLRFAKALFLPDIIGMYRLIRFLRFPILFEQILLSRFQLCQLFGLFLRLFRQMHPLLIERCEHLRFLGDFKFGKQFLICVSLLLCRFKSSICLRKLLLQSVSSLQPDDLLQKQLLRFFQVFVLIDDRFVARLFFGKRFGIEQCDHPQLFTRDLHLFFQCHVFFVRRDRELRVDLRSGDLLQQFGTLGLFRP